jgi:hypothetical protein
LAEKDIDVRYAATEIGEWPATQRFRAIPGTASSRRKSLVCNLCVAGHSPISVAAYHGHVKTIACLLSMEGVEI